MSAPVDRRSFAKTIAVAVAGAAIPAVAAQKTRRLKVGHTGITWGFNPADAEPAIKDVGSLGYHGYESFGNVLLWYPLAGRFLHPAPEEAVGDITTWKLQLACLVVAAIWIPAYLWMARERPLARTVFLER